MTKSANTQTNAQDFA